MDFDSAADELYGLDPSEFVAARRAAVARAKDSGDMALAKALGSLRKPTTTGWALNVLVRSAPESIEQLLDLGADLRSAQQALRGEELRSLAARRTAVLSALTDRAAAEARDRGHELPETALREIGQSLSAALADPDTGADLRRGRMLGAVSYSGFGPAALASVPPPTEQPPDATASEEQPPAADSAAEDEREEEEAQKEARAAARREAHERVTTAEAVARQTASDLEAATERAENARRQVAETRAELRRLEQESRFADSARRSAEEAAQSAAAELVRAQERAAELNT